MSGRIVTVFGASGFLGRHIVRALAKDGWRIRAAVRHPELAEFLRPMGMVGQIQPFKADLGDAASVAAAVRGADAVVNLVGIMHAGFSGKRFDAVHAEGAGRVAAAAKAAGATHLVHVSALGAAADSAARYARSKAAGESAVREAFAEAAILRPSVVFGQEDQFFNRFANMARYTLALPLIGGGETKFQPVFVGDIAAAVAKLLGAPHPVGATYELGGPEVLTFRQILELILKVTQRRRLLVPLPFFLAKLGAYPAMLLPNPPLTPDQVELLKTDNIVAPGAKGFADLGIVPEAAEGIVPSYLWRFRKTGQFEAAAS
jgi:NADH dehydrogenase